MGGGYWRLARESQDQRTTSWSLLLGQLWALAVIERDMAMI